MPSANFTELLQIHKNLYQLDVRNCKIPGWSDVSSAHKLRNFYIGYNKITDLPDHNGFPVDNSLEHLNIQFNNLPGKFPSRFLEGFTNLKTLVMNGCKMTKFPNVSGVIGSLKTLNMADNNGIKTIDPEALLGVGNFSSPELPLRGYTSMLHINFKNIDFDHFREELFSIFPNVQVLRINDNKNFIRNVPNVTMAQHTLKYLDISYNDGAEHYELSPYPTFLYETIFQNMTKLTTLHMNSNFMAKFPFSTRHIKTQMPKLKTLQLTRNLIQTIPDKRSLKTAEHNLDLKARLLFVDFVHMSFIVYVMISMALRFSIHLPMDTLSFKRSQNCKWC